MFTGALVLAKFEFSEWTEITEVLFAEVVITELIAEVVPVMALSEEVATILALPVDVTKVGRVDELPVDITAEVFTEEVNRGVASEVVALAVEEITLSLEVVLLDGTGAKEVAFEEVVTTRAVSEAVLLTAEEIKVAVVWLAEKPGAILEVVEFTAEGITVAADVVLPEGTGTTEVPFKDVVVTGAILEVVPLIPEETKVFAEVELVRAAEVLTEGMFTDVAVIFAVEKTGVAVKLELDFAVMTDVLRVVIPPLVALTETLDLPAEVTDVVLTSVVFTGLVVAGKL